MGRARKIIKNVITHTRGMVRNRGMEAPEWLEMVNRFPPPAMPRTDYDKLPKLEFPQDRLAELYARKCGFPTDDETAYEFADEQLTLIELGVPEKKAFAMLMEKYEHVEGDRFLQKYYQVRGEAFIPSTKPHEMTERWANQEAAAIKEGMRLEFEDAAEIAALEKEYHHEE
ncbi:hypothetical protein SPRG_09711 [Saprolegnia parasitica CBS 223.65]|uniref:Small ribosomal subunit protein mS23 n=1 Tax=Saprolegnia parasitica (strain CBS 223.65) TaxID=695850 RepID=A0A067CEJ7_SAPPC|nr:hypothetical protein SPRG_09711 [Saprolegnia parasitica CBS 223.65]KDO24981.1 hypothetical protein SPRG_09711 [Saprolegnia parasitica CBS 223.65]|eukprot:XP_012204250.1 hypothetical protein SPRG_09711 [Saprolegnia parasitica CBS 223.65]